MRLPLGCEADDLGACHERVRAVFTAAAVQFSEQSDFIKLVVAVGVTHAVGVHGERALLAAGERAVLIDGLLIAKEQRAEALP